MAVSVPLRIPRDRMVSVTRFSKRVGGYLDSIRDEPLFVVRGDSVRAVIVDIEEYEYLHDLAEAIEDLMLVDVAKERLETLAQGRTELIPFEEVLKQENISLDELEG